jgi:hypothetical protein
MKSNRFHRIQGGKCKQEESAAQTIGLDDEIGRFIDRV